MSRTKKLRASLALGVLAALITALLTVGIAGGATFAGAELEFAGDTAAQAAGQVEVPVECVGGPTGFCAGTLTLSSHGRRSTSTFSVQGGSSETVAVPLPVESARPAGEDRRGGNDDAAARPGGHPQGNPAPPLGPTPVRRVAAAVRPQLYLDFGR